KKNNIRFDLSDYLIHFFRDVDLNGNSYIHLPEHCGFNNLHHNNIIDAKYLLRLSLRHYKLFASWSYRSGVRTIYGYDPAVCFTDMPISAYLQSGKERLLKNEKIGLYALALPKNSMFSVGARPVIYGLDNSTSTTTQESNGDERILNENSLPLIEQYRYVTYIPNAVDWTHEREWRWAYRLDTTEYLTEIESDGIVGDIKDIPCLDFKDANLKACGVIVQFKSDIMEVAHDILTLIDRGIADKETFKFIISADNLRSPYEILQPDELNDHINKNLIILDDYFNTPPDVVKNYVNEINNYIIQLSSHKDYFTTEYGGEIGNAWVWIHDNQSEITRSLIQGGMIDVTDDGKYLLKIGLDSSSWPLDKKEDFAKHIATWLQARFNIESCYFSLMGSNNFNDPYASAYHDDINQDHPYYNNTREIDW
ncbi:DUF4427 domain-containing protein, partial [Pectobacterium parvum]